jgi:hypothetical protein
MKKPVSVDYVVGSLETDGTVCINVGKKGNSVSAEIRFSSKSNTNTLSLLESFCKSIGVLVKYAKGKESIPGEDPGRAPFVRITGKHQIQKFIKALSKSKIGFTGQKYRDFLLLEAALDQNRSIAEKIALKKSLHKMNRNDPDLKTSSQTKPRETLEMERGLPLGISYTEGEELLAEIDATFDRRQQKLAKDMAEGKLVVPPDYMKGVMDGDGSIGIAISQKTNLEFGVNVSLAVDGQSRILADIFKYVFHSKAQVSERKAKKNPSKISSYGVSLCSREEIQTMFDFYEKYGGPLGDLRQRQLELALELTQIRKRGQLRNYSIMKPFIDKVYELSTVIIKGRKRTSKDDILKVLKASCETSDDGEILKTNF